jgi:DNA-binding protein YbaB
MTTPFHAERLEVLADAVEDYPAQVADLRGRLSEAAAQTVTGSAAQGQVTASVTGEGIVEAVRVSPRALRQMDNRTVARYVLVAVNDALDEADRLVEDVLGDRADADADVDEQVAQYEQRMDRLLGQLDDISRAIDRLDG